MEYICELFDRKELTRNLFSDYCGPDEEYNFWKIVKDKMMDENVDVIEMIIRDTKNLQKPVCCRACQRPLEWLYVLNDDGEFDPDWVEFRCLCVMSEPIFKFNITECCDQILQLLDEEAIDAQLLAVSLNLVLVAMENMASPMPPLEPGDPVRMYADIYRETPYMLRLGGRNSVIFAELYDNDEDEIMLKDGRIIKNFPILYLADTVIPTPRYCLYPLRYKLDAIEGDFQDNLIEELIEIANRVIKAGSNLILGTQLKKYITPDCYKNRKHNLATIVDIDSLSIAPVQSATDEGSSSSNVAHIWDEIMKPIIKLCSGIHVLVANLERERTADEYLDDLKLYLNSAVWLKTFHNSPFETFLYAILTRSRSETQ